MMERKHAAILREKHPEALNGKTVRCLDIPDDFKFMDPDLVDTLQGAVAEWIEI